MADYDRNFTPVADLKRKREAEERRKALLTPRKAPESAMRAGDAWAARGNQAAAQLFRNSALRRHQERESDRIGRLQEQLLTQGSTAREKALDRESDLSKQRLAGRQQTGLQRLRGDQETSLQEGRLAAESNIAARKAALAGKGKTEGLTPKQRADIEKSLREEYFGTGRRGKELRSQYGERTEGGLFGIGGKEVSGGGVDKYISSMMSRYQPQATGSLPAAPTGTPSYGTITGGGGVLAASRGGQPVDPEQYAQSLLPNAPAKAQQQTVEQPTGRVQATLPPSPQQIKFDPMTSEAFKPPQTLAEFKRKQQLEKGVPALPGQERTASLIDKIRSERALRAGGKRYY